MDFIDHRSTANFIFSLSATDEKFRITNNGDVGIGTSSPSTKLEVNGVITTAGLTTTANINFGDNDKAVFGAGSDLQIFHDGSNSYVKDTGTGDLMLQGVNVRIQGATTGNNMFVGVDNGASTLYYQNNAKLATTSTGIDVTGTAEADTLETSTASGGLINIVRDDPTIGTNNSLGAIYWNSTEDSGTTVNQGAAILALADQNHSTIASGSRLSLQTTAVSATTPTERLRISAGGDISFYEDTGTTAKLFWDASAEALGIGTSAPGSLLELEATGSTVFDGTATDGQAADGTTLAIQNLSDTNDTFSQILFRNRNTSKAVSRIASLTDSTGTEMAFVVENNGSPAEILRLEKTGNVGIGTSSPTGPLHVAGSGSTVPIKIDNTGTGGDTWRIWSTNDAASDGGGKLGFYNEDTATRAMTLDSSGNVGIGTVSPTTLLEIKDTTATAGLCITADNASNSDLNLGDEDDVNIQRIRSDHTSNSLQFQTNNGERMRIDASGNLLVGTTSTNPAGGTGVGIQLNPIGQVNTSRSGGASGVFNRTTSDGEIIQLKKDGTTVGSIGSISSDLFIAEGNSGFRFDGENNAVYPCSTTASTNGTLTLGASGAKFKDLHMSGTAYIDTALGVGTTSPAAKVDIVDTAADVQLRVYKFDGTNNTRLTLTADDSGAKIHYRDATNGGALRFNNNAGEMARFDASSNLLVGKTSDNNAVAGTTISNSGIVKVTRTDWSLLLNRLSTDGSLALFQKDGTTVGSIGVDTTRPFIASTAMGVKIAGAEIHPTNSSGTSTDATYNLGSGTYRWKDLYLSGGVYLGGTGTANKLDDYEEGTWTPTIQGSTTTGVGVYSAQNGTYTKVGRLVTVQANISVTSWTTDPVGNLRLAGLPFSGKSGAVNTGSLMSSNFNYSVGGSDAITASVYMAGGTNNLRVYVTRDNATWLQQPVTGEAMEFIYSISYIVA